MKNKYTIEICAGSVSDCLAAERFPVDRIELNCALELGGLTPSFSTFLSAKKLTTKKIICMVRPRTAGFCYNDHEINTMFDDAELFLKNNADGIVFGFLNPDFTIDTKNTMKMVNLIHSYGKEAVFHKAFDATKDAFAAIEALINCHVDRILTSGLAPTVSEGLDLITTLQKKYGHLIQILPGCGINASNIAHILEVSQVNQFHMTAKSTFQDKGDYVAVDARNIQAVLDQIHITPTDSTKILTDEDEEMLKNDPYENEINPTIED